MSGPPYPGNPSLPPETQQRVTGTFRQSLDLAAKGSLNEASLGCDFVLRLDPDFAPARRLAERLETADGPIDPVEFLAPPSASAEPEDGGLELPDDLPPFGPLADDEEEIGERLRELWNERRFAEVVALADAEPAAVAAAPAVARLVGQARERLEAEPYLRPFLASAREAAAAGQEETVARLLEKARALDPTHPEIDEIAALARTGREPLDAGFPDFAGTGQGEAEFEFDRELESATESGSADGRISQLLAEGQEAFDRGQYQEAIDSWSRVFLIDIDHREAARRIEVARQRKAEGEREVEEWFHEAVGRFEAGDLAAARSGFERVLDRQPGYFAAREYLAQLVALESVPPPAPGGGAPVPAAAPPAPADRERAGRVVGEVFTPPEPAEARPARRRPTGPRVAASRRRSGGLRLFLGVGGVVLVGLMIGAFLLWQSRERLFPNSAPVSATARPADDPIARARALHRDNRTSMAISQLRLLPPDSPHHAEAQALISQWESLSRPTASATGKIVSPEDLARRDLFVARARAALAAGERVRALLAFQQAEAVTPLDPAAAAETDTLRRALAELAPEVAMFERQEWELLLNRLWPRHETDRRNADINRLMVDSYFNLGVRDLQKGDLAAAGEKFKEAMAIEPDDPELHRLALFVRTYQGRSEDLLARIFVKYLRHR